MTNCKNVFEYVIQPLVNTINLHNKKSDLMVTYFKCFNIWLNIQNKKNNYCLN